MLANHSYFWNVGFIIARNDEYALYLSICCCVNRKKRKTLANMGDDWSRLIHCQQSYVFAKSDSVFDVATHINWFALIH